jgi:hypothetical protein
MTPQLAAAIESLKEKGQALGEARALEQQLEDERALIKEMAIIRIMGKNKCASTPAEKIVESDLEYMNHRIAQRASVVARFRADAEYQAAKAEATQAALITPSMIDLEATNAELAHHVSQLSANVDDLVEANHSLLRARNEALNQLATADRTIELLERRQETASTVEGQ